jgi:G3E family GTPase
MTATTLVYGGTADMREQAIAFRLDPLHVNVVISEGLAQDSIALDTWHPREHLQVLRIAPGCPCCTGNLTMRVTLNRILRRPPQQLYLSLASPKHLPQIKTFLQDTQYQSLLSLQADIDCERGV